MRSEPTIEVRRSGTSEPARFSVTVCDGRGETHHAVTMSSESYAKLSGCGDIAAERLIEAAFRFLLDRETKESILAAFDVSVIGRYFPDFERKLGAYMPPQG